MSESNNIPHVMSSETQDGLLPVPPDAAMATREHMTSMSEDSTLVTVEGIMATDGSSMATRDSTAMTTPSNAMMRQENSMIIHDAFTCQQVYLSPAIAAQIIESDSGQTQAGGQLQCQPGDTVIVQSTQPDGGADSLVAVSVEGIQGGSYLQQDIVVEAFRQADEGHPVEGDFIEIHQLPHDAPSMEEAHQAETGNPKEDAYNGNIKTENNAPHDSGESSAEVVQTAGDGGDPSAKDVLFVCIHGQTFRCKPQAGIPVEAPQEEEPSSTCACSKSEKLGSPGSVVDGKLDRKLRTRKQVFTCVECKETFSQKISLEIHKESHEEEFEVEEREEGASTAAPGATIYTIKMIKSHQQKTPNECLECGRVFARVRGLQAHMRYHEREKLKDSIGAADEEQKEVKLKNRCCTVCEKKFTRMSDVKRHMAIHNNVNEDDRKNCGDCGKTFLSIRSRERHEEGSHCETKKEIKCEYCGLHLASKFKLLRHEREHLTASQLVDFTCKTCSKEFTNTNSLLRHEKLHVREKGAVITCWLCPESFEDRFSYNKHKKMHDVKSYKCELCNTKFKHEYLLKVHTKRRTCQKQRESLREVECKICQKVVKGTATLKRHMRTHTKEKPYPCRIGCRSSFSSTSNRLSHERMHCKMSPSYLCTQCGEVLSNQARLIYHESKYHGIGPVRSGGRTQTVEYPCHHCGKVFYFKGGRKRHERIHTNEKPYMCQYCPKAFVHASALVCHERVHTKARPYKCTECGKAFSQATHLKTHIRVHTKEKPYQCRYCDKAFSHMGTRKSHEAGHQKVMDPGIQVDNAVEFHHEQLVAGDIKVVQQEVTIPSKLHLSHHEHEVQAADVILQLLESGSRVTNFEGLVHIPQS